MRNTATAYNPTLRRHLCNAALREVTISDHDSSAPERVEPAKVQQGLSPESFRLLVDGVEDYAIFMLDADGRVLTWNRGAQRIKGYSASEIVGRHFATFYLDQDLRSGKPDSALRIANRDGRVEDEGWRLRKDGTRFWANVVLTALRSETGALIGFAKVTRDLTERRAARERLRLSEERFRLLVEGVTDYAIYMLGPLGHVDTWNAGAQAIKGYLPAEIIGRHYAAFFTPEDVARGRPEAELEVARASGHFEEEGWRVRKDGTHFWANVVLTSLRDSDGNIVGFAKVTRDLSARKKAEETATELVREQTARATAQAAEARIARQRERYKALSRRLDVIFQGIGDGITVQDHSGAVIFANSAAAALCGFSSVKEFLHTPLSETLARFEMFDEQGNAFDPANLPARHVLESGCASSATMRVRERPTGREWWTFIRADPVRNEAGETELAVNIWHDITLERKRAEHERYISEATKVLASSLDYEEMVRALAGLLVPTLADWCSVWLLDGTRLQNVAVAHVDPDRVARAREYAEKFPPDPQAPRGVWNVIRSGQSELASEIPDQLLQTVAQSEEHLELLRSIGMKSAVTVPIRARERIIGTISLISAESGRRYDATDVALAEELGRRTGNALMQARLFAEAKAAAEEASHAARVAEEASRVKDEFLATVSHELRTPLNAIVGWSALLKQQSNDPALKKGLDVIHRNAQAQTKIIEDILDVSRIVTGKLRLEPRQTDLSVVIQDAIDVIRPSAIAKQVSVFFAPPAASMLLIVDPERLQQVIWNLLSNAIKFTDAGGSVQVISTAEPAHFSVTVKDTGRGIDAHFLPYVFDHFKQADGSSTRRIGGLGLGLAIVRHIVELHGGTAHASSPGPGQGTTFSIRLPLRTAPSTPSNVEKTRSDDADAPAVLESPTLRGVSVLVVDDEPDTRELLRTVLQSAGATVQVAASADEAFARLKWFRPAVLISDIGMPGEDGFSLIRRVRALGSREGGQVPAVALTAYARSEDKMGALAAGFTAYISKPVAPEDVLTAVSNLAKFASS